jgi:hypothetical protein
MEESAKMRTPPAKYGILVQIHVQADPGPDSDPDPGPDPLKM